MADKTAWLKKQLSDHKGELECLFDQYDIDTPVSIAGVQQGIQRFGGSFAKSVVNIVRPELKFNDGAAIPDAETSSWSSTDWMNFLGGLSDLGLGVWDRIQTGKNGNFTETGSENQSAPQTAQALPPILVYAGGGILALMVILVVVLILKK